MRVRRRRVLSGLLERLALSLAKLVIRFSVWVARLAIKIIWRVLVWLLLHAVLEWFKTGDGNWLHEVNKEEYRLRKLRGEIEPFGTPLKEWFEYMTQPHD